jgi:hypothetical protein
MLFFAIRSKDFIHTSYSEVLLTTSRLLREVDIRWLHEKGAPFNYWDAFYQELISELRPGVVVPSRKELAEKIFGLLG